MVVVVLLLLPLLLPLVVVLRGSSSSSSSSSRSRRRRSRSRSRVTVKSASCGGSRNQIMYGSYSGKGPSRVGCYGYGCTVGWDGCTALRFHICWPKIYGFTVSRLSALVPRFQGSRLSATVARFHGCLPRFYGLTVSRLSATVARFHGCRPRFYSFTVLRCSNRQTVEPWNRGGGGRATPRLDGSRFGLTVAGPLKIFASPFYW